MVDQEVGFEPSFPECEFCDEQIMMTMHDSGGEIRKLKMNDGTLKEGWLCEECDPNE